jgi:predicted RNase H-like nuclease
VNVFIGVDLGWYGKPTGLASAVLEGTALRLRGIARLEPIDEVLAWILAEAGNASAVAGVDAPLVIRNETGIRPAERGLNHDFRRYHAGCHPANLGRPFAPHVLSFSRRLEQAGFLHGANMEARQPGRFQIEVHPHAATVSLFGLERIVKYKRGLRDARANELRRLRKLMLDHLPNMTPALSLRLPSVPRTGNTKPVEDQIDAVMCAYIAAHWWYWSTARNTLYGDADSGYIVVPNKNEPGVSFNARLDLTN